MFFSQERHEWRLQAKKEAECAAVHAQQKSTSLQQEAEAEKASLTAEIASLKSQLKEVMLIQRMRGQAYSQVSRCIAE